MKAIILGLAAVLIASPAYAKRKAPYCYASPDPPYQLNERWCKDGNTWWVTGRKELPFAQKINVLWWFGNDYEPTAPAWYLPNDPLRQLKWYLRNPLQNAGNYVLGIKDLNYTVHFVHGPPGVTSYADQNQTGCIYTYMDNSRGGNLWFPRSYVSCTGKHFMWYAGTQWSGFYGFKFNLLASPIQVFKPYRRQPR